MTEKGKTRIQITYEDKLADKVEALKKYYDVQSSAELVRVLVNERARQLNVRSVEATANDS